jgi:hypothetical protein
MRNASRETVDNQLRQKLIAGLIGFFIAYIFLFISNYTSGLFQWNVIVSERYTHIWMLQIRTFILVCISVSSGGIIAYANYRLLYLSKQRISLPLQESILLALVVSIPLFICASFYSLKGRLYYDRMEIREHVQAYQISLVQRIAPFYGTSGALELHVMRHDRDLYQQTLDLSLTAVCKELIIVRTPETSDFICERTGFPVPTLSVNYASEEITLRTPGGVSTRRLADLVKEE